MPPEDLNSDTNIIVCARKRPLSKAERAAGIIDAVTCVSPAVVVHDCKLALDTSPHVENIPFYLDCTFNENDGTEKVYNTVVKPLLNAAVNGSVGTCFAYGQTGSGKTYTMSSIEEMVARDLFPLLKEKGLSDKLCVRAGFFEISGDQTFDLLNERKEVFIREDEMGDVHVRGLTTIVVENASSLRGVVSAGGGQRTVHATAMNEESSRSHAVCQITLSTADDQIYGKLFLVDLAGSERSTESAANGKERQKESIEINKSLMALKECIRYRVLEMKNPKTFVPFRGSKITLLLKESFVRRDAMTTVIVTVAPSFTCTNHTIATCRFANRIKERKNGQSGVSSVSAENSANNPYLWDKKQVYQWIMSVIGNDKRCKTSAERVFTPMTGKRLCMLTEAEFAQNCIVPQYGRLLHEELWKLLQAKSSKIKVIPKQTGKIEFAPVPSSKSDLKPLSQRSPRKPLAKEPAQDPLKKDVKRLKPISEKQLAQSKPAGRLSVSIPPSHNEFASAQLPPRKLHNDSSVIPAFHESDSVDNVVVKPRTKSDTPVKSLGESDVSYDEEYQQDLPLNSPVDGTSLQYEQQIYDYDEEGAEDTDDFQQENVLDPSNALGEMDDDLNDDSSLGQAGFGQPFENHDETDNVLDEIQENVASDENRIQSRIDTASNHLSQRASLACDVEAPLATPTKRQKLQNGAGSPSGTLSNTVQATPVGNSKIRKMCEQELISFSAATAAKRKAKAETQKQLEAKSSERLLEKPRSSLVKPRISLVKPPAAIPAAPASKSQPQQSTAALSGVQFMQKNKMQTPSRLATPSFRSTYLMAKTAMQSQPSKPANSGSLSSKALPANKLVAPEEHSQKTTVLKPSNPSLPVSGARVPSIYETADETTGLKPKHEITRTPIKQKEPEVPPSTVKRKRSLVGLVGDELTFETLYQKLKQQTSDRIMLMLANSNSSIECPSLEIQSEGDDDEIEDAHILNCQNLNRSNKVLQMAANKAVIQEVLSVFSFRKLWLQKYDYKDGDEKTEAAWSQAFRQLGTGMDWSEFKDLFNVSELALKYRRLLFVSVPLSSLSGCFEKLKNRIESSPAEKLYWSSFGNGANSLNLSLSGTQLIV